MKFFNSTVEVLQTLVVALGAGLGVWGAINLLEDCGDDNPGANVRVPQGNTREFGRQQSIIPMLPYARIL